MYHFYYTFLCVWCPESIFRLCQNFFNGTTLMYIPRLQLLSTLTRCTHAATTNYSNRNQPVQPWRVRLSLAYFSIHLYAHDYYCPRMQRTFTSSFNLRKRYPYCAVHRQEYFLMPQRFLVLDVLNNNIIQSFEFNVSIN